MIDLANKRSSGADANNYVVLQSIALAKRGTLVKLINFSVVTRVFPEQLAVAKVILLIKKGSKEQLTNYGPFF